MISVNGRVHVLFISFSLINHGSETKDKSQRINSLYYISEAYVNQNVSVTENTKTKPESIIYFLKNGFVIISARFFFLFGIDREIRGKMHVDKAAALWLSHSNKSTVQYRPSKR